MDLHSQVRISRNEVQKGISHCCEIHCGTRGSFMSPSTRKKSSEGRFKWINIIEK